MDAPGLEDPVDQCMAEIVDGDRRGSEWFHVLGIGEEARLTDHKIAPWNAVSSSGFHSFSLEMM